MGRYSLDKGAVQGSKPWAGTKQYQRRLIGLGHLTFNQVDAGSNPVADAKPGDKMFTMTVVGPDHPLYIEPPKDVAEHVYSAVEFETANPSNAWSVVCYRTKDGLTHQAVGKDCYSVIRKSVKPFGK
jgi:hypothetical protein